jgi:hypothetical protein
MSPPTIAPPARCLVAASRENESVLLQDELDDGFPASDPPSITRPTKPAPRHRRKRVWWIDARAIRISCRLDTALKQVPGDRFEKSPRVIKFPGDRLTSSPAIALKEVLGHRLKTSSRVIALEQSSRVIA